MNSKSSLAAYPLTNEERFANFHANNLHIYDLFKLYALEALRYGKTRLSIALITERIRWEEAVVSGREFKLNNNHSAFYARLFHAHHPHLGEVFKLRTRRSN